MDIVTESLLREYSEEHGIAHLPEDKRFEHLSTFSMVHRYFSGESFETGELIVGEGGDTGIDGVAILVNGTLVTDLDQLTELCDLSGQLDVSFLFIQAERSSAFDASKISSLGYGVLDFFEENPKLVRNDRIKEVAAMARAIFQRSSKFSPGNPVCRMFYVTTGKWADDANLVARKDSVVSDLQNTEAFREVTFEPVDAQKLQRRYRETRHAVEREFTFNQTVALPPSDGIIEAYIGYLPAAEFFKIIVDATGTSINRALFFDNVRDWLGTNDVNDEIKATLKSPARARFALMNNGVTIIVRSLKKTGYTFNITDYSIVNGCQTSHVLFESKNDIDSTVLVPVRLIHTQDDSIINDIIKSTNRQTQVTGEQFFALEEFTKQLELYFQAFPDPQKRLYYERRQRQYDRLPIEKTRIVTAANNIKAFAAMFLNQPHQATRSYANLKARAISEIFVKGNRMEPFYAAAFALYKLDFMFRNGKIDPKYRPARFHIIMAARIISAGWKMPNIGANQMEKYCGVLLRQLWNDSEKLLNRAVEIVTLVAIDNFDRDNIRTEAFTDGVIAVAKSHDLL